MSGFKLSPHQLLVCNFLWIFLFSIPLKATIADNCMSPNNKTGACRSIYECPVLLSVIESTDSTHSQREFVRLSLCKDGLGRFPYVCCTGNEDTEKDKLPSNGKGNVLPQAPNCGPLSRTNKIFGGNETALDQYPWMVQFTDCGQPGCSGSLINQRYVLTAAHCVSGNFDRVVRLGEYDYSMDIDCLGNFCNQPVLNVKIEEVIIHPKYNSQVLVNDIALIRLAKDVEYTDFIRPVCLPLAEKDQRITPGEILTLAGWGRMISGSYSKVKRHVKLPLHDLQECQRKYEIFHFKVTDTALCAGGHAADESACNGDSGGPLMRIGDKERWYLEGIVSGGVICGGRGWPSSFTRVRSFIDWIQQNMRP